MDIEHLAQWCLVAASQVPCDRQAKFVTGAEHQAVTFGQLVTRQPAPERIVDVGIGTCLVQQDITIGEVSYVAGDAPNELDGLILALVLLPCGVVRDPVGFQIAKDLCRAVDVPPLSVARRFRVRG